jgi:DNA-binding beta-propeller fold protein YncE
MEIGSMIQSRKLFLAGMLGVLATLGSAQAPQAPTFEVDPLWPRPLPNRWILGHVMGVAVDSRDHVFIVHRNDFTGAGAAFNARTEVGAATDPPTGECCVPAPNVLEFDPAGNLVGHWGGPGSAFSWPAVNAGIAVDHQGNLWIGGAGGSDSQLLKFSRDGKFLLQSGKAASPGATPAPGRAGGDTAYAGVSGAGRGGRGNQAPPPALPPNSSSTETFGGPAGISFDAAANEGFVADGYRNHRVAVIDLNSGALKRYFGAYGGKPDDAVTASYNPDAPAPKQFGVVRCAELANDGMLYVCDRTNDRIQVFRKDGTFVKEQTVAPKTRGAGSVWDIAFSPDPQQKYLYVADGMNMKVWILDRQSLSVLGSFGDGGRQPGQFYAVHSVAVDSKGNVYTAESLEGKRLQKFVYKGAGPAGKSGVPWPKR